MPPLGAPARRRASQALRDKPAGSRRWIAAMAKQYMDVLSEPPRKAEKRRGPGAQDARKAPCRGVFLLVTFLCTSKEKSLARRRRVKAFLGPIAYVTSLQKPCLELISNTKIKAIAVPQHNVITIEILIVDLEYHIRIQIVIRPDRPYVLGRQRGGAESRGLGGVR